MTIGIRDRLPNNAQGSSGLRGGLAGYDALIESPISWLGKIAYLVKRAIGKRHSRSSIGALVAVAEPLVVIMILTSIRWAVAGYPDWNEAVFYATGVIPYFYFFHLAVRIRLGSAERPIPTVTLFDRLLATIIAETLTKALALTAIMALFYNMGGHRAVPSDPIACLVPVTCLMLCGVGVGLFNVAVGRWIPTYTYVFGFFTRILLFGSGVIIRPDFIPPHVRWLVEYNPIFHGVTWFRTDWYPVFPSSMLDKNYLLLCAAIAISVGGLTYHSIGKTD